MSELARIAQCTLIGLETHAELTFLALDMGLSHPCYLSFRFAFVALVIALLVGSWSQRRSKGALA